LTRVIWTLAILTITFWFIILTINKKHIKVKKDWGMQVLVAGYRFTWTHNGIPGFSNYDPGKK
jgi:hypothetical protein